MLISLLAAAQVAATPASDLNWVAGYWLSCDNGREVAEYWSDARGGVLFGTTVNLNGDRVASERTVFATINGHQAKNPLAALRARAINPLASLSFESTLRSCLYTRTLGCVCVFMYVCMHVIACMCVLHMYHGVCECLCACVNVYVCEYS